MTRRLRLWLLLACLFGAQLLAATHGVEHLRGDTDAATHVCLVCLATQGMDGALPVVVASIVPEPCYAAPTAEAMASVAALRRERAQARAPPAA